MNWSPEQYRQFEDDRTRPVRDLVAAVPTHDPARVIDIGCGPGNSTEVLAARFPGAQASGIDSSPEMIEAARKRLPRVQFEVADIATWADRGPFGVMLSNAALHWLPAHERLLPELAGRLDDDGSLAVQMPDNLGEPAYEIMRDVAADGPWGAKLADAGGHRGKMGDAGWYYGVLRPHCRRVDVWRTTYFHVLQGGPDAIVEWFKGSGLRPFLAPLDPAEQTGFLEHYRAGIAAAYPARADGSVLLPFPRLFMVATR